MTEALAVLALLALSIGALALAEHLGKPARDAESYRAEADRRKFAGWLRRVFEAERWRA